MLASYQRDICRNMSTPYDYSEAADPLVAAAQDAGALEETESLARKLASGAKYQQKEAKEALGRLLMTMASTPELLQQLPTTKQQPPVGYNEKAFLYLTRGYAEDHGHSPGGFDSGPGPVELPGHEQYCGARLVVQYDRLCSCGKTFAYDKRSKQFGHQGHSYQTVHICRLAVESLPASTTPDSGEWEEKKTKWGTFWFCRKVIAYLVFLDSKVYEGYKEKPARGSGTAPATGRSSDSGGAGGSSGAAAAGGSDAAAGCPSPTSSRLAALGGSSGVWQQPPQLGPQQQQQQTGDEGALQIQHLSIQEALRQTIGLPGAWPEVAAAGPSGSLGPGGGGGPCTDSGGLLGAAASGSSAQVGIKRRQGQQQQQQQVDMASAGPCSALRPVQGPVGHPAAGPEAAGAAEQALGEAEEGEPGAKALREPPAPWAEDRNRVWTFLHVRCRSYPQLVADLRSTEAADSLLLNEWEQLLSSIPVKHLQEMRIANGQCLAHWLATPPDYLDDAEVKQQGLPPPSDPDVPLPQRLAVGFIKAAIARLTVPCWRPLLLVCDDISKANPVHRVGRYGHRTQVLQLLLEHAPRCALLQYSQQAWLPYHTALRSQHEEAGGMLLAAVAGIADALAAAGAGTQEEVRSRLLYSLSNKWFQGKGKDQVPPFGHDLLLGRCRALGLLRREPRLLPKEEWKLAHAMGELGGLMALAGYLDRQKEEERGT